MTALEKLASLISQGLELGFIPAMYHELAQTALAETQAGWLGEAEFRDRTGASDKWCRQNFDRALELGLARLSANGCREWHIHARWPKSFAGDVEGLKREIVETFERGK
jgi:hypothetical protein